MRCRRCGLTEAEHGDTAVDHAFEAEPVPAPVTGGAKRLPVVDRHGVRLFVGDRLRAQVLVGRYGQTTIIEAVVTEAHWPYCSMHVPGVRTQFPMRYGGGTIDGASINTTLDGSTMRCHGRHHDVEHGHETWAEILDTRNDF